MPLTPRRDDDEHLESSPGALMEEEEKWPWGKVGWRFGRGEKMKILKRGSKNELATLKTFRRWKLLSLCL